MTFYADFSEGVGAWKAAGNPWPVGRHYELAGGAWTNTAREGYVAWEGRENVPVEAGTVSLMVRSGEQNIFADGELHCIASLPRTISGMFEDAERWERAGLALSLRKTEENTLDLLAHIGGDSWMRGSEALPLLSVDASGLSPTEWHQVAFSWNWVERAVWLVIDGEEHRGSIPEALEEPWPYLAACFGNTENYLPNAQEPLDGWLDEIAMLALPWPEAREVIAAGAPLTVERPELPDFGTETTVLPDDEQLAQLEWLSRNHLNMLQETQNHGGWDLNIQWPSLMGTNAKTRLPAPETYIQCSKDNHTAFGAMLLAFGYEALSDESYLDAAVRTAEMYLQAQDAEGWWCHGYWYEDGEYVPDAPRALIQDHVQTGPMMLMMYLHHITGEERFVDAAKANADFLLKAQNPTGSWPHHWNPELQTGLSATREPGAGEVNDYGTSGPIEALLWMHQFTGEERYREAALHGADWLVEMLIETDEVVGWAGQYDANNEPMPARHHEPAAVTQYAPRWAAEGLFAAWRATGDEKYLEPVRKVLEWFDANETEEGGWWWDYDIETGRPIEMYQRTIYYVDDPEQRREFMEASGQPAPKPSDSVKADRLRNQHKKLEENPEAGLMDQPDADELASYVEQQAPYYVEYYVGSDRQPLNEEAGLFTHESTAGTALPLVRHQIVRFLDLLMRARAVRGEIPVDDPVFRRIDAYVGWHKIQPQWKTTH
ncbi:MAG: hypothetical protein ACQER1_07460 [Armatimonadota bacterium]